MLSPNRSLIDFIGLRGDVFRVVVRLNFDVRRPRRRAVFCLRRFAVGARTKVKRVSAHRRHFQNVERLPIENDQTRQIFVPPAKSIGIALVLKTRRRAENFHIVAFVAARRRNFLRISDRFGGKVELIFVLYLRRWRWWWRRFVVEIIVVVLNQNEIDRRNVSNDDDEPERNRRRNSPRRPPVFSARRKFESKSRRAGISLWLFEFVLLLPPVRVRVSVSLLLLIVCVLFVVDAVLPLLLPKLQRRRRSVDFASSIFPPEKRRFRGESDAFVLLSSNACFCSSRASEKRRKSS